MFDKFKCSVTKKSRGRHWLSIIYTHRLVSIVLAKTKKQFQIAFAHNVFMEMGLEKELLVSTGIWNVDINSVQSKFFESAHANFLKRVFLVNA